MAIQSGYATLAEMKARWQSKYSLTAITISFDQASKEIRDSSNSLLRFDNVQSDGFIRVSGSGSNDGDYTLATSTSPNPTKGVLVVNEVLVDEGAGATVTITDESNKKTDDELESAVEAASRQIDGLTGRRFYIVTESRFYTANEWDQVRIDDLVSIDSLKTDEDADRVYEVTWASTDYDLMPANAQLDNHPYMWIEVAPNGDNSFPFSSLEDRGLRANLGVEVTGDFGYSAIAPAPIKEATLLAAMKIADYKNTVHGTKGFSALGEVTEQIKGDPRIVSLLSQYMKGGHR